MYRDEREAMRERIAELEARVAGLEGELAAERALRREAERRAPRRSILPWIAGCALAAAGSFAISLLFLVPAPAPIPPELSSDPPSDPIVPEPPLPPPAPLPPPEPEADELERRVLEHVRQEHQSIQGCWVGRRRDHTPGTVRLHVALHVAIDGTIRTDVAPVADHPELEHCIETSLDGEIELPAPMRAPRTIAIPITLSAS